MVDQKLERSHNGECDLKDAVSPQRKRSKFSDKPPQLPLVEPVITPNLPENINPLTLKPYSDRYYSLAEHRKRLPAWEARKNFIKLVKKNQVSLNSFNIPIYVLFSC
jgi:hypothetical protein